MRRHVKILTGRKRLRRMNAGFASMNIPGVLMLISDPYDDTTKLNTPLCAMEVAGACGIPFIKTWLGDGNDYLKATSANFRSADTDGSITAWVKKTSAVTGVIFSANDETGGGSTDSFRFTVGTILSIAPEVNGGLGAINGTGTINDGRWHFVAVSYDGAAAKFYIDGEEDPVSLSLGPAWMDGMDTLDNVMIGAREDDGGVSSEFDGFISDVRYHSAALTQQEIYDTMNGTEAASMVHRWKLETDGADSGSGAITLTETGGSHPSEGALRNEKMNGQVWEGDGVSDFISVPDDPSLTFGDGVTDDPFSFTAWVLVNDFDAAQVIAKRDTTGDAEYDFQFSGGGNKKLLFSLWDNSTGGRIGRFKNTAMSADFEGKWIHVTATYDGSGASSGIKLYLNGVRVDDTDNNTGSYTAMEDTTVGFTLGRLTNNLNQLDGQMAQARVHSVELTELEVHKLYLTGTDDQSANRVSYWKLDGDALDSEGTNNGTNTGGTFPAQKLFTLRGESESIALTGLTSNADRFKSLFTKRSAGLSALQFSDDGATWKSADGSDVDIGSFFMDGVNDFLTAPDDADFDATADLSIRVSTFFHNLDSPTDQLVSKWNSVGNQRSYSTAIPSEISFSVSTDGTAVATLASTNANFIEGQWYDIWITKSGTVGKFYVDGVQLLDDGTALPATIFNSTSKINLGTYNDGAGNFFDGAQSNIRIYTRAVTAAEILAEHLNGTLPATTSLAAWWKGKDLTDSSGNGHSLTNNGASVETDKWLVPVVGAVPYATDVLSFDGVNDGAKATVADYRSGDSSGSFSCWFKRSVVGASQTMFCSADEAGDDNQIRFGFVTDKLLFQCEIAGVFHRYDSDIEVLDTAWHQFAVTQTGTVLTMYLDGVAIPKTVQNGDPSDKWFDSVSFRDNATIGYMDRLTPGVYFEGLISSVAVYSSVLSATTVLADFRNGYPSETGRVNWWRADEGTGSVLEDTQGTDDGTITGATWAADRNLPSGTKPVETMIDVSALTFKDPFYYRWETEGYNPTRAHEIDDITVDT